MSKLLQKKLYVIISLFFLLTFASFSTELYGSSENEQISSPYDIKDEALYALLMYDLKNAYIQIFGQEDKTEGNLRTAILFGSIDLMQLKNQVINLIKEENVSLFAGGISKKALRKIIKPIEEAVDNKMLELSTGKGLNFVEALIYYHILTPKSDRVKNIESGYSKVFLHNLESIAISRLDHHYWKQKIYDCYMKNYQEDKEQADIIALCAKETGFDKAWDDENALVIQQIMPYYDLYENLK